MKQKFKRKRQGRTDYKKRLGFLKSGMTRLVVRKTNKNVIVQFVDYNDGGDKVIFTVMSRVLKKLGWKGAVRNIPSAYLTGLYAGVKGKGKVKEAIADLGFHPSIKGSLVYGVLKGVIDGGVKVRCSEEVFPDEKRLMGEHIKANEKTKFTKSEKDLISNFQEVKKRILENENL